MKKSIVLEQPGEKKAVGKIKSVHPFGSTVLVENLSPGETMDTTIYVSDKTETNGAPQAYVIELGPKLTAECGIAVGDRVVVQGNYVPVVNVENNGRTRGIVELHNIKAVIKEN